MESIDIVTSHYKENKDSIQTIKDYETENVSKKGITNYPFLYRLH